MHRASACQFAVVAAIAVAGCGFKQAGAVSPTGAAGTRGGMGGVGGAAGGGAGGTGGSVGTGGTGGSKPVIMTLDSGVDGPHSMLDANCGAKSKTAMKVTPDILIVLDRSGSMDNDVNDRGCADGGFGAMGMCGANSKWALITPAIKQVVGETDTDVNWGLKFFPDSTANVCNVGAGVAVPVGPGSGAAVSAAIMGSTNAMGGVMTGYNATPTRSALATATTYMQSLTDNGKKYLLLATDGLPNCPAMGATTGDDSAGAVTAVSAAATAGFPTFVVGIATGGMGTADTTLSNMANAGGLPRMGTPTYYPVTSAADLATAIRTLIGVAASCTFQIGPPPSDDGTTSLGMINVFGDGNEIMRDPSHTDGYDYTDATMQSIQVYGPRCDQIMSGTIRDVAVTFICIVL
jgi:hypothetical protein